MTRSSLVPHLVLLAITMTAAGLNAQRSTTNQSYSSGLFVGLGYEATGIVTSPSGASSTSESGSGIGVTLGYGFTPQWSLYSGLSFATINADGGGTYTLDHFDVGARVHFRSGPNTVVPFVQFGLSARYETQAYTDYYGDHTLTASGAGVFAGAGLNAHFTPAVAMTASITWSVGEFTNYQVDDVSVYGSAVNATSARLMVGVIWFPGANQRTGPGRRRR